ADQQPVPDRHRERLYPTHVERRTLFTRELRFATVNPAGNDAIAKNGDDLGRCAAFEEPCVASEQEPVSDLVLPPVGLLLGRPRQRFYGLANDLVIPEQSRIAQSRPHLRVEPLDLVPKRDDDERTNALDLVLDETLRSPREKCIVIAGLTDHAPPVGIRERLAHI